MSSVQIFLLTPFPGPALFVTALGEASFGQEPQCFSAQDLCKAAVGRSISGAPNGAQGLSASIMGNTTVATVNSSTPPDT